MAQASGIGVNGTAPSFALMLLEPQRALLESLTLGASAGLLRSAPEGDGHSVLVLPGFMASDGSTRILRRFLKGKGFSAHPWLLGRNLGHDTELVEKLTARVKELYERKKQPISLVGWSLGGIYAREIAKGLPEYVRQVVTLGSPFGDASRKTNATQLYRMVAGAVPASLNGDGPATPEELRTPPSMPSTAIYSKTDGIVNWDSCREPETDHTENIEIVGSHCGLGMNPLALYALADRLAQPVGEWEAFEKTSGWRRHVYK